MIEELTTIPAFREAMRRRRPVVITDSTGNKFHANPWNCGHVDEDNFVTKVIQGHRKGGRYYTVESLGEAQERWSSVVRCD